MTFEGESPPMNVRLHLAERGAKALGNLFISQILEVIQHERDSLRLGELAQGYFEQLALVRLVEPGFVMIRSRQRLGEFRAVLVRPHLGEEPPTIAITGQVVKAEIARHRL